AFYVRYMIFCVSFRTISLFLSLSFFFFFQAEDGIRDFHVTGVQTCALPILPGSQTRPPALLPLAGCAGHRRRTQGAVPRERAVRCPHRRPRVRLPLPPRRGP